MSSGHLLVLYPENTANNAANTGNNEANTGNRVGWWWDSGKWEREGVNGQNR